jgi:hypothetical protein
MEHNQRERVHHSFEEATTHEQIHRAFWAATSPEDVCQYLRVLDPSLEDTYLAQRMPMYYDAQGHPEQQSSLPLAYDGSNGMSQQFPNDYYTWKIFLIGILISHIVCARRYYYYPLRPFCHSNDTRSTMMMR